VSSPAEPWVARLSPAGAGHGLGAASAFGDDVEPVRLPFDLQRSGLFLGALAAAAMTAIAAALTVGVLPAVALLLGIGLLLAVAFNELLGLVLLAALVPITSGIARGLPAPGFRISELLVGGVGIVLLTTARQTARWTAVDWLALLYAAATFTLGGYDVLDRGASLSSDDLGLLVGPLQFLLLYRAVLVTARTPERRRLVLRLVVVASVPVSLLAIGQQLNVLGLRGLMVTLTGVDHQSGSVTGDLTARATGPFPHWHNLGGYLFMVLLAVAAVLIRRVPGVLPTPWLLTIGALDLAGLVESLSIAPMVGVLAGTLVLAVWLGGVTRVVLAVSAGLLVAALIFGPQIDARYEQQFARAPGSEGSAFVPQTIAYRYDLWTSQLLPGLEGRWLTGYGPDLPPDIQSFPYTESLYIGLLFRGGVILLAAWIALAAAMGAAGRRSTHDRDPLQHALGATVATAIVCLLFMQTIEGYFVDSGTPHVLWILLGLLAVREPLPVPRTTSRTAAESLARRRGWGAGVAAAFDSLDPGSRHLLHLSYVDRLSDDEIVGILSSDVDEVGRWRHSALRRLARLTGLSPREVEGVLAGRERVLA
jgi:hypothetical protein